MLRTEAEVADVLADDLVVSAVGAPLLEVAAAVATVVFGRRMGVT